MKILKVKISIFFVQIKKIRHFRSPKIWPPFFQSDVFCTLCIYSGITKGYRGGDKALEMDRKGGGSFGVHRKREAWETDKQNKKQIKNKQSKMLQISC